MYSGNMQHATGSQKWQSKNSRGYRSSAFSIKGLFRGPSLPKIPSPGGLDGYNGAFDLEKLVGAIQGGITPKGVRDYLESCPKHELQQKLRGINDTVEGWPAMFYVVDTRNTALIRDYIKFGGDPNAVQGTDPNEMSLLAFAMIRGGSAQKETTDIVTTLLIGGASPASIPEAFYSSYWTDLPDMGPNLEDPWLESQELWGNADWLTGFTAALNVTTRYKLYQARKTERHTARQSIIVSRQGAEDVLGLQHMIIGQSTATRWLKRKLMIYLGKQTSTPLVLVFAGPSGHGKTELARSLGQLMSLDIHEVDCTNMVSETDLFGPHKPYQGWDKGSPLNDFLAHHRGKRSIVFLDEFEKTTDEIHNTLLILFQDGQYRNRRSDDPAGDTVDCSKTIWILATNLMDNLIHAFWRKNKEQLSQSEDEQQQDRLVRNLCRALRSESIEHWGAPITGRITDFVPFLPFSSAEQAVVAHKAYMDFEARCAGPVRLGPSKEDDVYAGHIKIHLKRDAAVCLRIAEDEYIEQLGARSIFQGVERLICEPIIDQYEKDGDLLDENQGETRFVVALNIDREVETRLISKL